MRWKPNELLYEMQHDKLRRILFVEGIRDQAFWGGTISPQCRAGTVIYPISSLKIDQGTGGERGRLLRAAAIFEDSPAAERIHFVADTDADRILNKRVKQNITLTDGRDLESYALSPSCLGHLCDTAFPISGITQAELLLQVSTILKPIGILRIVSDRHGLRLPFQQTFERQNGLSRFITGTGPTAQLDLQRLVTVLIQNSSHQLNIIQTVLTDFERESVALAATPIEQTVHGKDLLRLLAWRFGVSVLEIERLLFVSIKLDVQRILQLPNIGIIQNWLR